MTGALEATGGQSGPVLRVGLVNNMPDEALAATERQFRQVFEAAACGQALELVLFSLPQIERSPAMRERMDGRYQAAADIPSAGLSAVVVTGARPSAGSVLQEPLWPGFAGLVDMAADLGLPTFWSCLAAHAAVARLDGIERRRVAQKYFGVFECAPAGPHRLLAGLNRSWPIPHSRMNDLPAEDLLAHGYEILTASPVVGADVFAKPGLPFLFCQGHVEYDADTLMLEYRRDMRLFEQGIGPEPAAPEGYAARPPMGLGGPEWRDFAAGLFGNWLRLGARQTSASTSI